MARYAIPFEDNLIAKCGETVVADFEERLPDLSGAVILLPDALRRIKAQFVVLRSEILACAQQRGYGAVIPPTITTVRGLFVDRCLASSKTEVTARREQLAFAHALAEHPDLFPNQSPWQATDALLSLFNEISELSDSGEYDIAMLERDLRNLKQDVWNDDSNMFLALWKVWKDLISDGDDDPHRLERMAFIEDALTAEDEHIYLCGTDKLTPCQTRWARKLYAQNRLTLLLQDTKQPLRYPNPARQTAMNICGEDITPPAASGDFSRFFEAVFADRAEPLQTRAKAFAAATPDSPAAGRLRVFQPASFEQHAWGAYLAIKDWMEQGCEKIGIVSLDRKLTRRMLAAFDRYGLVLQDYSGWELSTTSAAAALYKLLPDERGQFDSAALITLMRSPFFSFDITSNQRLRAVGSLERCLAKLPQLPQTAEELLRALPDDDITYAREVGQRIIEVLAKLQALATQSKQPLTHYFSTLFEAMEETGMRKRLAVDAAGKKLLDMLGHMQTAAAEERLEGGFYFWRGWLMHSLEHDNYVLPPSARGILLMTPRQARLWRADALVFAALDGKRWPALQTPLMNEKIRCELGLETQEQKTAEQFLSFLALLESAPRVLLTCQRQSDSQQMMPSPWLRAIMDFHQLAYNESLADDELAQRARRCHALAEHKSVGKTPRAPTMPAPAAPRSRWPEQISASAHQTLIDCPYRFFVQYCLKLRAQQPPGEYWSKAEFGTRMHKCLQELHAHMSETGARWSAENAGRIRTVAEEIIEAKFRAAADTNYANTYWLDQARTLAAIYIDWFVNLSAEKDIAAVECETKKTKAIKDRLTLTGTIDLMMDCGGKKSIADYKTGHVPATKMILSGEDVQLACYALLTEDTEQALYLALKDDGKNPERKPIKDEELADYCRQARLRLEEIYSDYMDRKPLPAWGNEKTACQYCDWQGLCRRPVWQALDEQQDGLRQPPHGEDEQSG